MCGSAAEKAARAKINRTRRCDPHSVRILAAILRSQARKFFDVVVVHGWLQVVGSRLRRSINLVTDKGDQDGETPMGLFKKQVNKNILGH